MRRITLRFETLNFESKLSVSSVAGIAENEAAPECQRDACGRVSHHARPLLYLSMPIIIEVRVGGYRRSWIEKHSHLRGALKPMKTAENNQKIPSPQSRIL
jgi:hypothetical protein